MKLCGFITRRRCMGKNLAFADILIQECNDKNFLLRLDESSTSASRPSAEEAAKRKIEVMFQRGVPESVWRSRSEPSTATGNDFPNKNAALPYGALIALDVVDPVEGKKAYRVEAWQILENPKEEAVETAREGRIEGVSCSLYLKKRCEAFSKFNTDTHKLGPKKKLKPAVATIKTLSNDSNETATGGSRPPVAEFSHGSNRVKGMRATIFATWLIETYGREELKAGGGVLDVAGGKGKLSIQLALQGKIPSTVIDPLVRKHGEKLDPIGAKRIRKAQAPHPTLLSKEFNRTSFLENTEQEELIQRSSIMVGLHPDEPTEDILDMALQYGKNVAIVPCCVFPCFFPLRTLPNGKLVRTYEEFLEYLLAKDDRLRKHNLPFEGRNTVIYLIQKKAKNSASYS